MDLGKGIVACIGIDASKKLLRDIENELKSLQKILTSDKFEGIREFIIKRVS